MDTTPQSDPGPLYTEDQESNTLTILREPESPVEASVLDAIEQLNVLHSSRLKEAEKDRSESKMHLLVNIALILGLFAALDIMLMAIFGVAL